MHLFSKENIWSNPHASSIHPVIQTSTIILWTELFPKKRREKIQGEILQSIFEYRIQWCFHISTRTTSVSTHNPTSFQSSRAILHTELILPQEILQLQGSSRAVQYKASSSDCSHVSKHSTGQNKAPDFPTSIPGPYSTSRLPAILPGRNSTPSSRQHPHSSYSSSQVHSYRILPGEIGFFPKGLSIVCPCNTKVSVFQFTYSCA